MPVWTENIIAQFHQKNSARLLKNLKNTTGLIFCRTLYITVGPFIRTVESTGILGYKVLAVNGAGGAANVGCVSSFIEFNPHQLSAWKEVSSRAIELCLCRI